MLYWTRSSVILLSQKLCAILVKNLQNYRAINLQIRQFTQYMIKIDSKNEEILRVLEQDGRISNVDLAERVGLSASACLRRVQELEKTGTIRGYRAVIDPAARGIGMTIFVMVGLSEHRREDARAFESAVSSSPLVRECHNVTGNVEYLLRIEVPDLAAYRTFHDETLGSLSQVHSIISYICLASPKDERA